MRKWLFEKFQSLMFLAFLDTRLYLLVHRDVRVAGQGKLFFAWRHFIRHGRNEGRSFKKRLIPFVSLPRFFSLVRATDDYFSGANFKVRLHNREGVAFALIIAIWPIKARIKRLNPTDEYSVASEEVHTIYWSPVPRSAGRVFLVALCLKRLGFIWTLLEHALPEAGLSYSNPESHRRVPTCIVLSPVTACNLNCPHCMSQHTRKKPRQLSDEIWAQLTSHIEANEICHIASDYSGDIFFAQRAYGPWLDRVLDAKVELVFDTHANSIEMEDMQRLMQANISYMNFSIDSMDPETYRKIRKGSLPLSQVLKKVSDFMELRNRLRPDMRVCLSMALMKSTLDSIIPALEFASLHKISWVQGNHLMVYSSVVTEESVILDMASYAAYFERATDHARQLGVGLQMPAPFRASRQRIGHTPCTVPWDCAMILGNGDVMACAVGGTTVGNLHVSSLEDIYRGPAMMDFRSKVNTDVPPDACSRCVYYRFDNNFESYVPGLSPAQRAEFVTRVLSQPWFRDPN